MSYLDTSSYNLFGIIYLPLLSKIVVRINGITISRGTELFLNILKIVDIFNFKHDSFSKRLMEKRKENIPMMKIDQRKI